MSKNKNQQRGGTHLYRLWNSSDDLLYVGISKSALTRLGQHQRSQPWADEICRITIERFDTRGQAETAEVEAIAAERPKYNVRHAVKPTNMQLANEQWRQMTAEERAEAKRQMEQLAQILGDLRGTQKDLSIAAHLALFATSLDLESDEFSARYV